MQSFVKYQVWLHQLAVVYDLECLVVWCSECWHLSPEVEVSLFPSPAPLTSGMSITLKGAGAAGQAVEHNLRLAPTENGEGIESQGKYG